MIECTTLIFRIVVTSGNHARSCRIHEIRCETAAYSMASSQADLQGTSCTSLPPVVFITVGRLSNISGGYIFGLAVVNGLRALGHAVDVWELEPSHPLLVKGTAATAFEKGADSAAGVAWCEVLTSMYGC